ncbi:hypothetical protein [Pelagibius sp.]|uniref:hypothetical protein n=1 Tax=Pelagibius sp. TaxID=1931238 RepID=UPI0026128808|nr:hypothetical protein [Pelagibius sp.]
MVRIRRLLLLAAVAVFAPLVAPAAQSPDGAALKDPALKAIADFADRICGPLESAGSSRELEGEIDVSAEIGALRRFLVDLGVSGAARLQDSEYTGLLQEDLLEDRRDTRNCRSRVFDRLAATLIKPQAKAEELRIERGFFQRFTNRVYGWSDSLSWQGGGSTYGPDGRLISRDMHHEEATIGLRLDANNFAAFVTVTEAYRAEATNLFRVRPEDWKRVLGETSTARTFRNCQGPGRISELKPIADDEYTVTIAIAGDCDQEFSCETRPSNALRCEIDIGGEFRLTKVLSPVQ